jgi:cell fate (sporulation/competence/biofilm development) regulator YlbF (YheA/YmcA/DUF963 family)
MKNFLLILMLSITFGCEHGVHHVDTCISFVDSSKDSLSGGDVRFSIINSVKTNPFSIYILKSVYNSDTVGFQLIIPSKTDSDGSAPDMQFRSLGKISRSFKNDLAQLYNVKINESENFVNTLHIAFVDLDKYANTVKGKDRVILEGKASSEADNFRHYKLFFGEEKKSGPEDAELFINVNERMKVVELREKDAEYRKAIIGFLTQKN